MSQIPGGVSTNKAISCEHSAPFVSLIEQHLKDYRFLIGILIRFSLVQLGKPPSRYIVVPKNNTPSKRLCDGFGMNVVSRKEVRDFHNLCL